MRRLLAWSAAVVALFLAALAGTGAAFLADPGVFVGARAAGQALRYFGRDYSPRWSSLRFTAESVGRRRHRYDLEVADLCVADRTGAASACFSRFELGVTVSYSRRGPTLERVDRLVAVSDDARVDLRRRGPGASAAPSSLVPLGTPVGALLVELSSFTVLSSSGSASGSLRAAYSPGGARPFSLATDLRLRGAAGAVRLRADAAAASDLLDGGAPTFVDLTGGAAVDGRAGLRGAFRLSRTPRGYAVSGGAALTLSTGPVRSLALTDCAGSASVPAVPGAPAAAVLSCRYGLEAAAAFPPPFGPGRSLTGTTTLTASSGDGRYRADLKAGVAPIGTWCELDGEASVGVAGRAGLPLAQAVLRHSVHATLRVARFEELVALLRESKYAVPAPIHVLTGSSSLTLDSRGDPRSSTQTVRYAFESALAGGRQRLVLTASGTVTAADAWSARRSFAHDGDLVLRQVALELPRLDIVHEPAVFLDRRITTGGERAPSRPAGRTPLAIGATVLPLRGLLRIRTETPLILFSNLAKEPVPMDLDLRLSYPAVAVAGRVAVRRFGVELFRRTAIVDHLDVVLSSAVKAGALDGLVLYKTPAVEIHIAVTGTTERPEISLSSVPPLKREDIIALLVFGKEPNDLDPDQTVSVDNTETALESNAFGLASLYLFGTTPVEHVGYDSVTRTASVKMRLPGGANLTMGSDFDQSRQLTVRKPLAAHWAIQEEVTDQVGQGRAATTFLEWFERY